MNILSGNRGLFFFAIAICAMTSHSVFAAKLYSQGFENGDTYLSEGFKTQFGTGTVVSVNPKSGSFSYRANMNQTPSYLDANSQKKTDYNGGTAVDPITNLPGDGTVSLSIDFSRYVPAGVKEVYFSYYFLLDKCDWDGTNFTRNTTDPLMVDAKLAFMVTPHPTDPGNFAGYYIGAGGGASGNITPAPNHAPWVNWESTNKFGSAWTYTKSPWGADGKWHHFAIHIKYGSSFHLAKIWVDGNPALGNGTKATDGWFEVHPDFKLIGWGFWYTSNQQLGLSKPVAGGVCNGWQVDDIELWDGLPKAPKAPQLIDVQVQ